MRSGTRRGRAVAAGRRLPMTVWAGVAWAIFAVTLVILSPSQPCTVDTPCGPTGIPAAFAGTFVVGATVIVMSATLAPYGALLAAAGMVGSSLVEEAAMGWKTLIAAVATLIVVTIGARHFDRVGTAQRRERAAAGLAVGTWPGSQALPAPVAALVLVGLAIGAATAAVIAGVAALDRENGWQDATPQVRFHVTEHSEDTLTVFAATGDRDVEFEPLDAADYPVGSTVLLWHDGTTVRPVAEPYDPLGWNLAAVALAVVGLSLGVRLFDRRREIRSVLTEPVPLTRVAVLAWGFDEIVILDATDSAARHPRFRFRTARSGSWGTEPEVATADFDSDEIDDWDDDDGWRIGPPVGAVAYGYLDEGQIVAVKLDGGEELLPRTRLKSARSLPLPDIDPSPIESAGPQPPLAEPTPVTVPAGNGLILGARGRRLVIGLAELAIAFAGFPLLFVYNLFEIDGIVSALVIGGNALFMLWVLAISGFAALTSSIHARPEGMTCVGILKTTTAPWNRLRGAAAIDDHLVLRTIGDSDDIAFILPMAWIKETDQRQRILDTARALTARIQIEKAIHGDGIRGTTEVHRRWRPAGVAVIAMCALLSAIGIVNAL